MIWLCNESNVASITVERFLKLNASGVNNALGRFADNHFYFTYKNQ